MEVYVRNRIIVPKIADLAKRRFQRLEDSGFQERMVANEFVNRGADEKSIFLVKEHLQVSV